MKNQKQNFLSFEDEEDLGEKSQNSKKRFVKQKLKSTHEALVGQSGGQNLMQE